MEGSVLGIIEDRQKNGPEADPAKKDLVVLERRRITEDTDQDGGVEKSQFTSFHGHTKTTTTYKMTISENILKIH